MVKMQFRPATAAFLLLIAVPCLFSQVKRHLYSDKGEFDDTPVPHLLQWWTKNPLRLDMPEYRGTGDLMLGFKGADGKPITTDDYKVEEHITTIGALAGHKIVQIVLDITPGPNAIAYGATAVPTGPPAQWKEILVQTGNKGHYIEIYAASGQYRPFKLAKIYGSGPNAILRSYDLATGRGGCSDGYWWFDKLGPHEVDFAPLYKAIGKAIPKALGDVWYLQRCGALTPVMLESEVQQAHASCVGVGGACASVGEIVAAYNIVHGAAIPYSVTFTPGQ